MTWVAWRLQRTEMLIAAGILVALTAILLPSGLEMAHAYSRDQLGSCLVHPTDACGQTVDAFGARFRSTGSLVAWMTLLPGLIGVQQEWLRGFVEDYLAQQMRLAGAFHGIAHNVVASAAETVSENIDRMQQEGQQMAETAGHEMNRMANTAGQQMDQMAQDANTYMQGTQH